MDLNPCMPFWLHRLAILLAPRVSTLKILLGGPDQFLEEKCQLPNSELYCCTQIAHFLATLIEPLM